MDSIDDITVHYYKKFDKKKQKQKNYRNKKTLKHHRNVWLDLELKAMMTLR